MKISARRISPWHPGAMIKKDFLADYGLTQHALAKALHISRSRLTNIIKGRRGITADIALRLSRYFGNSAEFWLNLQIEYDLKAADTKRIEAEIVPQAPVLTGLRLPIEPPPAKNFSGLVFAFQWIRLVNGGAHEQQ